MTHNKRSIFGLLLTLIIVLGLGIFIFFNTRLFIAGPQINVLEPINGTSFNNPFISIKGTTKNASYITINDHPIFIDENGNFDQRLLLSPGTSIIKFYAKDKFNREVSFLHQYVFNGQAVTPKVNTSLPENSTTTEEVDDNEGNL